MYEVPFFEQTLSEFADRERAEGAEGILIKSVENETGYVVVVRIDQCLFDNFVKSDVGTHALGGHALALTAGRDAGELVAGLFFVSLREDLAQIGECESLVAQRGGIRHGFAQ